MKTLEFKAIHFCRGL